MLYAVKDHCYRPTNRQIDNFNHAWRDVPLDLELERAARLYKEKVEHGEGYPSEQQIRLAAEFRTAVYGTKSKKRGGASGT